MDMPVERELPGGRHDVLREYLMNELREAGPPPRRSIRRFALAGALAAVVGLVVTLGPAFLDGSAVTPAYAIDVRGDSVTVTLRHSGGRFDTARFEREMAAAGMPTRVVEIGPCGYTAGRVRQWMVKQHPPAAEPTAEPTAQRTAEPTEGHPGSRDTAPLKVTVGNGRDTTFEVTRGRQPVGQTLVMFLADAGFVGIDFETLPAGWRPCTALNR
ncbi:hypothetical protein [Longispora fulva]|uniref:Uncharacterized protein n=1 Tax=Longispora fulva TaxID=619741 RepID=A0A8J7KLH3_9ACTN|nr:hypothetical protein [Longispora fulva]MBG6137976.1 hypothetical protein [Longispora fulva]